MSIAFSTPLAASQKIKLSSFDKLILETVKPSPKYPQLLEYDFWMPSTLKKTRYRLYWAPVAWFLNLWGPNLRSFRATLMSLEYRGLITFHLESQHAAEGHGMINWDGPAARRRYYNLTALGVEALEN